MTFYSCRGKKLDMSLKRKNSIILSSSSLKDVEDVSMWSCKVYSNVAVSITQNSRFGDPGFFWKNYLEKKANHSFQKKIIKTNKYNLDITLILVYTKVEGGSPKILKLYILYQI